jgi:hypothetical protein
MSHPGPLFTLSERWPLNTDPAGTVKYMGKKVNGSFKRGALSKEVQFIWKCIIMVALGKIPFNTGDKWNNLH